MVWKLTFGREGIGTMTERWEVISDRLERRVDEDWRRELQAPEEMIRHLRGMHWDGKRYRNFVSPNVICLERYRRRSIIAAIEPFAA